MYVVSQQKSLLSVKQRGIFLLHKGIHPLQLFEYIHGSTVQNDLLMNDPLVIQPDPEHHLLFEIPILSKRSWELTLA